MDSTLDFKIQLKESKGNTLAFVTAYHKAFKHHRFIWSTGIKVKVSNFDPGRPGSTLKRLISIGEKAYESLIKEGQPMNNETLKNRCELIRDRVAWAGNELHIWDGVTVQYFHTPDGLDRGPLQKKLEQELTKQKPDFKKVIDSHITDGQTGLFGFWQAVLDGKIKSRHGKKLRTSTVSGKRQTMLMVKEFDPLASFERMDMRFYNTFTIWMAEQTRSEKDGKKFPRFDSNTIGKHIKNLKSVLRLAYANDLIDNTKFEIWSVTKEKNEVVALSKDDIVKINELELSGTKKDVRDIFLMACFLGPRISDFKTLEKDSLSNTTGITFFEYVQEKTGARVKIPVHPVVQNILLKRDGNFPKMISEQNFRSYLKEICKAAELNDRVITKIRDGKPEYKKKWEAISPHSARRTFASSLFYGWFNKPMPASFCMRYTGHKTEKSFMVYIGASEKDLDAKALEYFNLQPAMKVS